MRFWDASALIPLLVDEETTPTLQDLYRRDPALLVWWATDVECVSAITRRERDGALDGRSAAEALSRLDALRADWHEVQPASVVRQVATRLLRVHPLRAADSLQLAAALTASEGQPPSLEFVCLDDRLADAAGREGLSLVQIVT